MCEGVGEDEGGGEEEERSEEMLWSTCVRVWVRMGVGVRLAIGVQHMLCWYNVLEQLKPYPSQTLPQS